jgi:hypothetical protein
MISPEVGYKINTKLKQATNKVVDFAENHIPQTNKNILRYSAFRILRTVSQKVTPEPISSYKGYKKADAEPPKEKYVLVKERQLNELIEIKNAADQAAISQQTEPITLKIDQPQNGVDRTVVTAKVTLPRKDEIVAIGKAALDIADAVTYVAAEGLVDIYKRARKSEQGIAVRTTFRRLVASLR